MRFGAWSDFKVLTLLGYAANPAEGSIQPSRHSRAGEVVFMGDH